MLGACQARVVAEGSELKAEDCGWVSSGQVEGETVAYIPPLLLSLPALHPGLNLTLLVLALWLS